MEKPIIKEAVCDLCGKTDPEVAHIEIEKKALFFRWVNKFKICQGCVSRLFQSFNSSK